MSLSILRAVVIFYKIFGKSSLKKYCCNTVDLIQYFDESLRVFSKKYEWILPAVLGVVTSFRRTLIKTISKQKVNIFLFRLRLLYNYNIFLRIFILKWNWKNVESSKLILTHIIIIIFIYSSLLIIEISETILELIWLSFYVSLRRDLI